MGARTKNCKANARTGPVREPQAPRSLSFREGAAAMGDFSSLDCAGLSPRNLTGSLHKPSHAEHRAAFSPPHPTPTMNFTPIYLVPRAIFCDQCMFICVSTKYVRIAHIISLSRLLHAAASQVVDATLNHQVAGLHLPWTRRLKHDRETMTRV